MAIRKLHPKNYLRLPAAGGRRTDYYDTILPGFVLRVSPNGPRTFAAVYSRDGRTRRFTIGETKRFDLAEAREEARRVLARVQLGADPQAERAAERRQRSALEGLTLEQLGARCLERIEIRAATRAQYERLWRVEVVPRLGRRPAGELTRAEVLALLEEIHKRAPYVANRTLAVLRRVYAWGLERDLVQTSPCAGVQRPGTEKASERVLTAAEVGALWRTLAQLGDERADATALILLTGSRLKMVLELRRDELLELDSAEPRWVVPAARMKNHRQHVVPLSPAALQIVRRRLAAVGDDAHLFPGRFPGEPAAWSTEWFKVLRAAVDRQLPENAGLAPEQAVRHRAPRWTMHNLRHTAGTHMLEVLKVQRDVVSLVLSHTRKGSAATRVYDRSELLSERRAALVAWAARVEGLAKEERGAKVLPIAR